MELSILSVDLLNDTKRLGQFKSFSIHLDDVNDNCLLPFLQRQLRKRKGGP
jgi:hypothetical protein